MARIAAFGGLMMAVNSSMPHAPRLEIVNVLPWYSSGLSVRFFALSASARTSVAMSATIF